MTRPSWDFDYRSMPPGALDEQSLLEDMVIATEADVDPARMVELLGPLTREIEVRTVLSSHPLFWTRVRAGAAIDRRECALRLCSGGVRVRYVASACWGSQQLAPPLELQGALGRRASRWTARAPAFHPEPRTAGRWFLEEVGVNVRRGVCGTGAGTRLAVIDDDAAEIDRVDLDRQVAVGVDRPARGSAHGAHLVAWAVRAAGAPSQPQAGTRFVGVAPNASPRLYLIPKPGQQILALPLAIVRAVDDGADVILCATNVDGQSSPMLDDALQLAAQLGRDGLGAAVIMPCGREPLSPEGSVHSSFSLGPGEPASDPRVLCIGPSGRDGGWFLWSDPRGRLRPFANRGPAVRFLAPGDDIANPFCSPERLAHAESSGAAAIAAGVLLLVLGSNPELALAELDGVLCRTVSKVAPNASGTVRLANPSDALPSGRDPDGHNAKHGYGRLNAARACMAVSDPVAAALVYIGEDEAAQKWLQARRADRELGLVFSEQLARWGARLVHQDQTLRHALCAVARTLRLVGRNPDRLEWQSDGSILRQLVLALRTLAACSETRGAAPPIAGELRALMARAAAANFSAEDRLRFNTEIRWVVSALWPPVQTRSGEFPRSELDQTEQQKRLRA